MANATLAGVLAGFMLNGIVVLLSRQPGKSQQAGYVKGAAFLFTAFVALGLDSYLFGLVTGDTSGHACRRAWTEAMYAAGLLGLGAVAVVAGIVFLLGVFFSGTRANAAAHPRSERAAGPKWQARESRQAASEAMLKSMDMLAELCIWLRPGVALVVMLLLAVTARNYLFAIFPHGMPSWANGLFWGAVGVDGLIFGAFVLVYLWGTGTFGPEPAESREPATEQPEQRGARESASGQKALLDTVLRWLLPDLSKHQQFAFAANRKFFNGILNLFWNSLRPDAAGEVATLRVTVYSSLIYSLISVVAATVAVLPSAASWNSSGLWVTIYIFGTVVWVLVLSLIPLGALLAPSFGPKASRAGTGPARSPAPKEIHTT